MDPHFGAGAGQAMEVCLPRTTPVHHSLHWQDAFVLGRLLTHELTHLGNVADALKVYEDVRLPFANSIVQRSLDVGLNYSFRRVSEDGSVPARGSPEELDYVRKAVQDGWEWQSRSAWMWGDAEVRWRAKCTTHAKL